MTTAWRRPAVHTFPTTAPVAPATSSPSSASSAVDKILEEVDRLPAARPVVLRVLQLIDDPDCSAQQLATAAGVDVTLTAKLLRLSNSAYYGLGGRVTSVPFAITVVGFETVRAIAVAAMTDLSHDPRQLPENFWSSAALTAVASGAVAGQVGARQPEAFCVGLLADLGAALLFRADPQAYGQLPAAPVEARLAAERDLFGITHPRLGERVLEAWSLPKTLTSVIGAHHDPITGDDDPLRRAYAAGHEIASRLLEPTRPAVSLAVVTRGALAEDCAPDLLVSVQRQAEPLIRVLTEAD